MNKDFMQKVAIVMVGDLLTSSHAYDASNHECDYFTSVLGKKCIAGKNYAASNPNILSYTISATKFSYIEDNGCVCAMTVVTADGKMVMRYVTDENSEHCVLDFVEDEDWITDLQIIHTIENRQ